MLFTETANLVIASAKGIIKLSRRFDMIYAEKEATEGPLALPMSQLKLPNYTINQVRKHLEELLERPVDSSNDPLGEDRVKIRQAIDHGSNNNKNELLEYLNKYRPELKVSRIIDLNNGFRDLVEKDNPGYIADADVCTALFLFNTGKTAREKDYTWRLALTVVDTLAEFGAENTELFVRDPDIQNVVRSVLTRVGSADVQELESGSQLFKQLLAATINGALDARGSIQTDSTVLNALLDTFVDLRSKPNGENLVVGLINGEGYKGLVAALVAKSATLLDDNGEKHFKAVSATYLTKVAAIIKGSGSEKVKGFFEAHWGDLLRAGFATVETHGPAVLSDSNPAVRDVLVAIAGHLSQRSDQELFSTSVLIGITDTTISAVVTKSDLLKGATGKKWLDALIGSVANTLAEKGVKESFTKEGADGIITNAFAVFAANPQLIIEKEGLPAEIIGGVMAALSKSNPFVAEQWAVSVIEGSLTAISDNPQLLKFNYSELVVDFSGRMAKLVQSGGLSEIEGRAILHIAITTVAENPKVFFETEKFLAKWIVDAIEKVASNNATILSGGTMLIAIARSIFEALARTGVAAHQSHPANMLRSRLIKVIEAGLARAEKELGNKIQAEDVPEVIRVLIEEWAWDRVKSPDPDGQAFKDLFSDIIKRVAA